MQVNIKNVIGFIHYLFEIYIVYIIIMNKKLIRLELI